MSILQLVCQLFGYDVKKIKNIMIDSKEHYDPHYEMSSFATCDESFSLKTHFLSLYNVAKKQNPEQIARLKNYLTVNKPFLLLGEELIILLETAIDYPYIMPSVDTILDVLEPLLQ